MSIDRPSAALGNISDIGEVDAQVSETVQLVAPGHNLPHISEAFTLLGKAFCCEHNGSQLWNTLYHKHAQNR